VRLRLNFYAHHKSDILSYRIGLNSLAKVVNYQACL